ncbi:MAG: XisI protein [Microscillaceae bacterium]|jgi:hypothetical protein|nr:XisI protein [Microscillaceae bacterium]
MEKLEKYQLIVQELLGEFAETNAGDQILADHNTHHYQLLRAGEDNKKNYFFRVRMHFFINSQQKICILENRTELEVADYLIEKGVPKSDIIPAFLPSEVRKLAGYAV